MGFSTAHVFRGIVIAFIAVESLGCGGGSEPVELLQPAKPTNGPGAAPASNPAQTYSVGGVVSGLGNGKSLVLRNNGANDLTVSTNGTFTFANGLATGTTYDVTVQTQPEGQTCTISNASGTIDVANVTTATVACVDALMKWDPGHYFMNNMNVAATTDLLQKFADVPIMKGIQRQYSWSSLEPEKGKYTFDAIDTDLALAKKYGKKLSLMVMYKYSGALPKYILDIPPTKVGSVTVPSYFVQGTSGDGPYNTGEHANFGHPETLKGFDGLLKALAQRYDDDSGVAFLQFGETSIGATVTADVQTNYLDGVIAMNRRARAAFVSTPLIQSLNFPRNRLADFVNVFVQIKMGFGGPDVFWGSLDDPKNALGFVSDTQPGIYQYNLKNNGKLPVGMQIHNEDLMYATRELQLAKSPHDLPPAESVKKAYDFAIDKLGSNYIIWQVFGSDDPYRAPVDAALKAGTMPVKTACPTVYDGTCESP